MTYIIADIHGCFQEYKELLDKINFSDEDELYVLGDAMDRGPEPIRVIRDLMRRPNVTYIMGNHDAMMLNVLSKLSAEITEESIMELTDDVFIAYHYWMQDGGKTTLEQFSKLSKEERKDILDFLEFASPYETMEHEGKLYILVHAGIDHFDADKELDDYDSNDFLWKRTDYTKQLFPSSRIYLVTGHTPTRLIREDEQSLIYCENNHIALDCGCVYGGALAAYCIESGEAVYIAKK